VLKSIEVAKLKKCKKVLEVLKINI